MQNDIIKRLRHFVPHQKTNDDYESILFFDMINVDNPKGQKNNVNK